MKRSRKVIRSEMQEFGIAVIRLKWAVRRYHPFYIGLRWLLRKVRP